MNQFQQYAKDLISNLGLERALLVSESCLTSSKNVPNTFYYDEAQWYLDKEGGLSLAKDQKKFAGIKERRLSKTANFWTQVNAIIKKEAKNATT